MGNNSLAKAEQIQEVAHLFNVRKMSKSAIAQKLEISTATVNKYLEEWQEYVSLRAAKNSDILENFIENLFKFDDELEVLAKEAWAVVDLADEHGAMATKLQALRLAKDVTETKARMFQIMSPRMESGYMERMKRIERVNGILSVIIQDTISGCNVCSPAVWAKLEEAFRLMPDLEGGEVEDIAEPPALTDVTPNHEEGA